MKTLYNPYYYCFALLVLFLASVNAFAQTAITSGVSYTTSTTATLWVKPVANVDWVDAHYNTGGAQQNIRMTYNAANARYEQVMSATPGTVVNYSFTYAISGLAYDTATFSATVVAPGSSSSSKTSSSVVSSVASSSVVSSSVVSSSLSSSSSSVATGITNGVVDNSTSAIIWLKPNNVSVSWVDIHYNVNTTGQQNLRMTYNATNARYEQVVSVTPAVALNISYSFTYQTPTGAQDTAGFVFNRVLGSSSSSLSSVASSVSTSRSSASSVSSVVSTSKSSSSSLSSAVSSSKSSSSVVSSSSSSLGAYVQGVSDLGATSTIWFKSNITQQYVILHYSVGTGSQINPQMTYNTSLARWEAVITPVSAGVNIHYNFTYQGVNGNLDSPWYNHVVGVCTTCPAKPNFSPLGGSFFSPQSVSLSTNVSGGVIHYTLDGSAPNALSPVYSGAAINVTKAATINAITVIPSGEESAMASQTYVINSTPGTLNPPAFSHVSGTYGTIIRVSLAGDKEGAYVHYTLDGSTPTVDSPVYSTPIEVKIDTTKTPAVNTTTIKAIAVKTGWTTSAVNSATYTITNNTSSSWNGLTSFNVVNGTKGKYTDSQVYWAIIGKDWNTGQFVHVDMNGNLIPMSLGDNGQLVKNGQGYANYFYSLAQTKKITIPAINSARLLMSVGSPMYIWVNQDINGNIGYAGANVENPTDPNTDITFDFGEFAIIGKDKPYQGIFINTTRVDMFGFPVQLTVTGLDGFTQTVGEPLTESRDELFARFINETPSEFHGLALAPYAPRRIMAPAHATFQTGGENVNYLSDYINTVWEQYRHQNLTLNLNNGWPTFTGHVEGDVFIFTDGQGTYRINGKPTTSMAMLGNGYLDDSSGATGLVRDKQLQLQAQVCAALNRRVAHLDGSKWYNSAYFFPAGEAANYFTKFWHDHALNGLTYGFSYDDVGGYSPSVYTSAPVSVTYTIGW